MYVYVCECYAEKDCRGVSKEPHRVNELVHAMVFLEHSAAVVFRVAFAYVQTDVAYAEYRDARLARCAPPLRVISKVETHHQCRRHDIRPEFRLKRTDSRYFYTISTVVYYTRNIRTKNPPKTRFHAHSILQSRICVWLQTLRIHYRCRKHDIRLVLTLKRADSLD